MYMCTECKKPYCGGRVDCAAQQNVVAEELCCPSCEWAKEASDDSRRCMLHGHASAIYKCDSCCSVATWNCTQHHFCERCHREPWTAKNYPCPGPGLCPLGIPHPPNVPADLTIARDTNTTHRSFVIGCLACLGFQDEAPRPVEDDVNHFGFPVREWSTFASGAELLKVAGEKEVRERLRMQWPALPRSGSILECSERLLLSELKPPTAAALVNAAGSSCLLLQL